MLKLKKLKIPNQIAAVLNKEKVSVKISTYEELKTFYKKYNTEEIKNIRAFSKEF